MRTWTRWVMRAVVVGLGLVPMTGRGEAPEDAVKARRTVLLAQPLYGSVGQLAASVEHAVGSHVALAGAVEGMLSVDESTFGDGVGYGFRRWGVGVDPGVHFYLAGRAPEGLWVGPHAGLAVTHVASTSRGLSPDGPVTTDSGWRAVSLGGSARVGYTAILSSGLSLQVAAGYWVYRGFNTDFAQVRNGVAEPPPEMGRREWYVGPRMTLGVGWAL